jgi:2-dehydropantoate 2-reductase
MKIVVVGPGAVGCLIGGLLARAGQEVWLLDKDPNRAQKLHEQGIQVEGISGRWQAKVSATSDASLIKDAEMVIICVKSYDTRSAVESAEVLVGEDTSVLTLQNGIGNIEIIQEVISPDKVLGGITSLGATLLHTGHIRHAGMGETMIGRLDGKIVISMRRIREVFQKAGLPTKLSRDIKGLLWSKLIINAGINALTAVTHLKNGQLLEFEGTHGILRQAVTEAVKVAKKKRIRLAYDDPLAKVESVCEATGGNVSSMLQDILKKKRTEIDFINGVIVRQGQSMGIDTPVNKTLADLVKTIEASYLAVVSPP